MLIWWYFLGFSDYPTEGQILQLIVDDISVLSKIKNILNINFLTDKMTSDLIAF